MKAIIIGSGVAGLTAGALLSKAGIDVTVFEQFPMIGGVTATVTQDGYRWDLGPLLLEGFAPGDRGRNLLIELGISDQVRSVREDRMMWQDEIALQKPQIYAGPYWRRERLKEIFPKEIESLDNYYRYYDQVIKLMGMLRQSENASGLQAMILKLRMMLAFQSVKKYVYWNGGQLMDHFFASPALKTFFLGIVADFVTAPSEFPALGVPTIHLETAFDKRIPVEPDIRSTHVAYSYLIGGCQTLVDALASVIRKHGGSIHTQSTIKKIMVEQNRAVGVQLSTGEIHHADLVLASGGMHEVFFDLVGEEHLPAQLVADIRSNRLMESVLMVHLGIDFDPRQYQPAALCYYYGTDDLESAVHRLRNGDYHEGQDGFLVYVPSLHSPSLAPEGCNAVTIYTVAPDTLAQGSWEEHGEELADRLVACAEAHIPDLRQHTRTRLVLTPEDFRTRTHLKHHSFGGSPPVIGNKPPAHKTPIDGLWFIGAQSESGGGVIRVMSGAEKVARTILRDYS